MDTVIDIFNKKLIYNKNNIEFIIDTDNNIWFKFASIAKILKYKSNKDALRVHVDKINKKSIRDINSVFKKSNEHNDTIYINETGLYILLIRSRMKNAISFQLWLVHDVLPNLRKDGKVEVNHKIKIK